MCLCFSLDTFAFANTSYNKDDLMNTTQFHKMLSNKHFH